MRNIYLTVLIGFVVCVFLFIVSFIYLDKHNHVTLHYNISLNGQHVGTTKIDKFTTEEKILYKSVSEMPFRELFTGKKVRIDLNRRYTLESYQKELTANGTSYFLYAENKDGTMSFLSKAMSEFNYLSGMPVRKGVFVFEEDSPVTYMPIIENYDFRRGRSQGFSSLVFLPENRIPPMKRFVTLTSIRNEYVKIGRRKIKTENLMLKIKGLPPGNVWVAKSDKSLIMIEIPSMGLRITRSFDLKQVSPKERATSSEKYTSKDVTFNSKGRQLSGTLTSPSTGKELSGTYPAVLLIWGAGPQNRDYQGFFESISDYLSKNGYSVLRFDKKGIGSSSGKAFTGTQDDELADIAAAVNFLKSQKNVDAERVAVIAHSEGAFNALRLAAENNSIRSLILMAPAAKAGLQDSEKMLREKAIREKWDPEYLKSVLMAAQETDELIKETRHDWRHLLGKRCYLKTMRVSDAADMRQTVAQVAVPVLIIHGKNDAEVPAEEGALLDKALSEYGKVKHSITYYSYLGHFFGKLTNDGTFKMHYEVDDEVLVNIRDWLDANDIKPVEQKLPEEAAIKVP